MVLHTFLKSMALTNMKIIQQVIWYDDIPPVLFLVFVENLDAEGAAPVALGRFLEWWLETVHVVAPVTTKEVNILRKRKEQK